MFSRWGAFVYRFRRPVALVAVIIAIASSVLATQTSSALSAGGWLDADSESAAVAARLDTEFGAGKSSVIALFRSDDARGRREVRRVPGGHQDGDRRAVDRARGHRHHRLRRDRRSALHQHRRGRRVHRRRAERHRRGSRSRSSTRSARRSSPPAGYTVQLTGYGPITKDSAEQSEKDLQKAEIVSLPDRRARPDPRLRLDRRGRDAAARRRPGDPEQPRPHLPRRPAGRDEHLRAQHRDDARARPGDRLLAVHRQPLPRGTAPRPDRRRGGRTRGGDRRQGRRLQRHRGRDRAVRPAPVRGTRDPLDRHRRRARRALLGRLRADLPAGRPRDARPSRQRAVAGRSAPPLPARSPTASSRPGPRAGSASRTPSCAGRSPSSSRRWPSCSSSAARSCASSRACPAPRSTRPASRAATRTSRSRPSSPRARRRRSSSSPTSPGSPTDARQHQGPRRLRRAGRRASRASTGSRARSPSTTRRPAPLLTPEQVAALYALPGRPASGRPRRPPRAVRPRLHGPARRDQPAAAVAPGGDRPDPGHPRDPRRATGITTQVGGSAATGHDFLVSQAERAPYAVGLTLLASGLILFLLFGSRRHPDQGHRS